MVHRFLLFCEEVENFVMEIKAPSTSTFKQLHDLIIDSCGYIESGNHRFLLCDEDWRVQKKIYLHEKKNGGYDEDLLLMEDCYLEDYIEEEGQRIAYAYDMVGKRTFLMELVENIYGEKLSAPIVSRKKGVAPEQFELPEIEEIPHPSPRQLDGSINGIALPPQGGWGVVPEDDQDDSNFYGDDSFEDEEIDMEGFEVEER